MEWLYITLWIMVACTFLGLTTLSILEMEADIDE